MARVPNIIRRNNISQVAPQAPVAGQEWVALGEIAKAGEEFIRPAAHKQAREEGEKSVYRDDEGNLQVDERSVLGGELAEVHNVAGFSKYMAQSNLDMNETYTELANLHQYDPAAFKDASDAYVKTVSDNASIPSQLREGLVQRAKQEAQSRFNGLHRSEIKRTEADSNRDTKIMRDHLADDYTALHQAGDVEGAEAKLKELQGLNSFRKDAPFIAETEVQTEAYMAGVVGNAEAARLMRDLDDLSDKELDVRREEIMELIKDPNISASSQQKLYRATKGRLKGVDAKKFVDDLIGADFHSKVANVDNSASYLANFAVGGAKRSDSFTGMNKNFSSALAQMIKSAPAEIRNQLKLTSGFRSVKKQGQLWESALKKYGSVAEARKWVAPPGKSQHNHGNAGDLKFGNDAARKWVHANAGKFGLEFPLSNENWHIELSGARTDEHRDHSKQVLTQAGVPVNEGTELATVLIGAEQAAIVLSAEPDTPITEILSEDEILAAPEIKDMDAGEFENYTARKAVQKTTDLAVIKDQINEIEDDDVRAMSGTLLNKQIQARRATEAQSMGQYKERLANDDDTMTSQEILEDHSLSDADQLTLVNKLDKKRKGQITIQDTVAKFENPNAVFLGGTKEVKSVDEAFMASIENGDPLGSPEAIALSTQIASRTGYAPRSTFNAIRAGINSGDPARVAIALEAAEETLVANTNAFQKYVGKTDITNALSDYRLLSEYTDPVSASTRLIEMQTDEYKNKIKNSSDKAKDLAKNLSPDDISGSFDTGLFSNPTLGIDTSGLKEDGNIDLTDTEASMMAEYTRLFKSEYAEIGSVDLAKARALDTLGRVYNVNTITGSESVMKFPPRAGAYPEVNGSRDWMHKQITSEITAHEFGDDAGTPRRDGKRRTVRAKDIHLVSDTQTGAEMNSDPRNASWKVFYVVDGVIKSAPDRFHFDSTSYKAAADQALSDRGKQVLELQQSAKDIEDARRSAEFDPFNGKDE